MTARLSKETGDQALRFSALHGLSIWYLTRAELAKALEVGATMIELPTASGNSARHSKRRAQL